MSRRWWYADKDGEGWRANACDNETEFRLVQRLFEVEKGGKKPAERHWTIEFLQDDECFSTYRKFPTMDSAKFWAEGDECFDFAKAWSRRVRKAKCTNNQPKQVAPEQRIVLGYTVYLKDGTTAFCAGALRAIKEHFGPDWVSIMPVLAYQFGELEDLGQIIDRKV